MGTDADGAAQMTDPLIHSLYPPAYMAAVHARLAHVLERRLFVEPMDADDEPEPVSRYIRKRRTRGEMMLDAMHDRGGPMTAPELAVVARMESRHVHRALVVPTKRGLCVVVPGDPKRWSLA